jgi:cytochrome c-type biogenesis protein CcmF
MGLGFPGHMSIFLACAFNLVTGISFLMVARGNQSYRHLAHKSYNLFTLTTAVAVAYLFYLFFSHDFAFKYVHNYSDSTLSFFYTLSAFWGGQEGTYLLWLFMNCLFGYVIIKHGGQYKNWAMFFYSIVNFFFLVLLVRLSPFAPLGYYVSEGAGLNPLLQDPWMVIHPPVIFIGYSMSAVPFVIALAAMVINDYSTWIKRAFPWVAITVLMLAAGNILGGYWAYKTLGWGGFWAWDPVENSSFIPWFISLALLHGMIIEKRTGAMRKSNLMLAAFVFILVVYGTFLTRSGVLSDFSVHSFADLGINNYLISFLALFTTMTLALFVPRIKSIGNAPLNYNYFGREFVIFAGLMILFVFAVVVLFWTSLPIITSIFSNEPRAADQVIYNSFALLFGIIFSLFLTVSPFLTYAGYHLSNWKKKLIIVSVVSVVIGFGLFYLILGTSLAFPLIFCMFFGGLTMFMMKRDLFKELIPSLIGFILTIVICLAVGVEDYLHLLYFASAAMVIISNLTSVVRHLPHRWKAAGGQLSHFGFGLLLLGILGSSAYSTNHTLVLPQGVESEAFGRTISYQGMENDIDYPHNKLLLEIRQGSDVTVARPELYYSRQSDGIMRKPFIDKTIGYDLYFSPVQVEENPTAELIIDVSKKPLINLVWVGTTVMLIGAVLVFGRRREESVN